MASSTSESDDQLPLCKIPGDCGLPFFGPVIDRYCYYYTQGREEFLKSRMLKYKSTVFRANMPPGPSLFMSANPRVIVLLDAVSFSVLLDLDKVEKTNVLDGTYKPPRTFTGGYRPCAYLDPSDPKHAKLKQLYITLLASLHQSFIPEAQRGFKELFDNIEAQVLKAGSATFNDLCDDMSFDIVYRLLFNINPRDTEIGKDGALITTKWLFFQLHPLMSLGLPKFFCVLEDLLLHTFQFPFCLLKNDYNKVYDVIYNSATSILDEAEKVGLKRDEACHNLLFLAGFNAFGGMKALFPVLMKWVGLGGEKLHKQLTTEIRTVFEAEGGQLTFSTLDKMELTKSVVYEALRIEPPVPYQYAKAKKDFTMENHEARFEVKKGELLFGFQPFATNDPKVFVDPGKFVGNRFVGAEGERLLKYVYWSNGRETEEPTEGNKQCAGKDLVITLCRVMIVEFFLRYDSFTVELGSLPLGPEVKIKSLTRATHT